MSGVIRTEGRPRSAAPTVLTRRSLITHYSSLITPSVDAEALASTEISKVFPNPRLTVPFRAKCPAITQPSIPLR
jgi:hypothetical protein